MEVDTNLDLSALFKDGHNVSDTVWVLFLSNEATFDESLNFSLDCLHDVGSELSLLLFDLFSILFNVETMHGYLRIKSRHVFKALGKDVYIFFLRDIRFCFSVSNKLLFIEMSFG